MDAQFTRYISNILLRGRLDMLFLGCLDHSAHWPCSILIFMQAQQRPWHAAEWAHRVSPGIRTLPLVEEVGGRGDRERQRDFEDKNIF